jgi:hypothetical protein
VPRRAVVFAVTFLAAAGPAGAQSVRTRQYLGLARATLEQPVTHRELADALLSPAGVGDVAALFEQAIAAGIITGGAGVVPELGGEATLDRGVLRLVEYPDPRHAIIRRMVALRDDPPALLDFLTASVDGQHILSSTGGLHAHLFQMTTKTPTAEQRRVLDGILAGAVATHFKTWTVSPELQQEMIDRHDWRGRYVGFWHLHPPLRTNEGLSAGLEPSMEDMRIALEKQQLLTIVFRPDGFDAWDLEPLAKAGRPDLSLAKVIRHRSPEWARRFAGIR